MSDSIEAEKPTHSIERRFLSFWMQATPKIFEWFGWIAALGVTQFVYAKTKSLPVLGLLLLGYAALLFYTHALFASKIEFSFIRAKHHREFVSGLVAIALTYATNVIAQHAAIAFGMSAL